MTPREYDMTVRVAAAGETRRRILEAALELRAEQGISGTSWQDIAARADVSVGTVYRYFPGVRELVPACGELLFEKTRRPASGDARAVVGEAVAPVDRLERAALALFAFYERAGAYLDSDPRERELPEVQAWEEDRRKTVTAFVREALGTTRVPSRELQLVTAFFDFGTFSALRARGVSTRRAATTVAELVAGRLGLASSPRGRRTADDPLAGEPSAPVIPGSRRGADR